MSRPVAHPDILLILTDQWNPRMLGCSGDSVVRTPNLDRLAREGIRFDNAYTSSPVCMPARCSLASGQFPHQHGFWNNFTGRKFPAERVTLYRQLREVGYSTAKIGKYHLFNLEPGEDHADHKAYYEMLGLDWAQELPTPYMGPYLQNEYTRFLQSEGVLKAYVDDIAYRFTVGDHHVVRPSPLTADQHIDGYVAQRAVEYIDTYPQDRPMFLCVSFPGPHTPLDAPEPYGSMYDPEDMILAPNIPARTRQGLDQNQIRQMQANYYGKITLLDDRIGQLLRALEKRGNRHNTLVLFAADHGEYLGSHGRLAKGGFHEESARIPMILNWPGKIKPGRASSSLVSWLDLHATVIQVASGEDSSSENSRSLLPICEDTEATTHDAVFSEIGNRQGFNYMVRAGRYKWTASGNGTESLVDVQNDPYETENLVQDSGRAGVCQEMKEHLLRFLMHDQENHAAGYKPLFERMGLQTAGRSDSYSFLRRRFYQVHGL